MTDLPLDPKALEKAREAHFQVSCYMDDLSPAAVEAAIRAYLEAAPQPAAGDGWMPIETAKKDGSVIWAKSRPDIYPTLRPGRGDLEAWNGVEAPLRHPGVYEAGGQMHDHGWNVALPVGCGGLPDEWIAGWRPLPAPPSEGGA